MTQTTSTLTSLLDVRDVVPLDEDDRSLLHDVADVLRKHNAIERFGLSLLHRHFPIGDDEVMLETTDVGNRTQCIRPVPRSYVASLDYTETAWRLDTGQAILGCVNHRPRPPK
jgi:hypothetical protein